MTPAKQEIGMKFSELSFVGADTTGEFEKVVPWNPVRTGDYSIDCTQGRVYFAELRKYIIQTGNPSVLSRVLAAQVRGGVWDAVEIGFSQAMAEALLVA